MKTTLTIAVTFVGVFTLGFLTFNTINASDLFSGEDVIEQRVNANLLRVKVNGKWHDVPMVELSEHLCESEHPMFRRYCE
jgi:hypothetical protein